MALFSKRKTAEELQREIMGGKTAMQEAREASYARMQQAGYTYTSTTSSAHPFGTDEYDYLRKYAGPVHYGAGISKIDKEKEFTKFKKSFKKIEAEKMTGQEERNISRKIARLEAIGAVKQAEIVKQEARTRAKLAALTEWPTYKLLERKQINEFNRKFRMTSTTDGIKLYVNKIEDYIGNPAIGEAKDRIIPDNVIDEIELAKERELFDELHVLWAEKVKDPIVLGTINGCSDYFYIAEWGDDITFNEILKGERNESESNS